MVSWTTINWLLVFPHPKPNCDDILAIAAHVGPSATLCILMYIHEDSKNCADLSSDDIAKIGSSHPHNNLAGYILMQVIN